MAATSTSQPVSKSELIHALATQTKLSTAKVRRLIDAMFVGKGVKQRGFSSHITKTGSFKVVKSSKSVSDGSSGHIRDKTTTKRTVKAPVEKGHFGPQTIRAAVASVVVSNAGIARIKSSRRPPRNHPL